MKNNKKYFFELIMIVSIVIATILVIANIYFFASYYKRGDKYKIEYAYQVENKLYYEDKNNKEHYIEKLYDNYNTKIKLDLKEDEYVQLYCNKNKCIYYGDMLPNKATFVIYSIIILFLYAIGLTIYLMNKKSRYKSFPIAIFFLYLGMILFMSEITIYNKNNNLIKDNNKTVANIIGKQYKNKNNYIISYYINEYKYINTINSTLIDINYNKNSNIDIYYDKINIKYICSKSKLDIFNIIFSVALMIIGFYNLPMFNKYKEIKLKK